MHRRLAVAAALFALAAAVSADDPKQVESVIAIPGDKADKIETEGGSPTAPTVVTSQKELEKAIPDEKTRKRVGGLVDLGVQDLVIFAWRGSRDDRVREGAIQYKNPPNVSFLYTKGAKNQPGSHVSLFAVAKGAWVMPVWTYSDAVADIQIRLDKGEGYGIETKGGKATSPTAVTSEKELEKAVTDEKVRKQIARQVNFKEQTLLVFAWEGPSLSWVTYGVADGYPEQITFVHGDRGGGDPRPQVQLYAVRNDVKWSVK